MSVTVIIPTYNRAVLLERAMMSVFSQTKPCDELIIVDDGSDDNTRQLVNKFAVCRTLPVRYIYQENRGAAAARNIGVKEAQADYICFLDSDDCFEQDKLAIQHAGLKVSGLLISHTRETWFRRGSILHQKKKHLPREGYIFPECLGMCVVGMSTVMAKKELFALYGVFDEHLPCCEDYDFWLRVSAREHFHLVNRPLTVKDGGRPDQLSVIHRQGMDRHRIRSIINLLERGGLSAQQRLQAVRELARKCRIYGKGCLKHGRTDEGEHYLQLPEKYL